MTGWKESYFQDTNEGSKMYFDVYPIFLFNVLVNGGPIRLVRPPSNPPPESFGRNSNAPQLTLSNQRVTQLCGLIRERYVRETVAEMRIK